ncbi:hypothetical protein L345_03158 [Ophiophagus hannah]|uniref:Uncharacterized protein n=1 Tax=Ophiophagus hannah TaxID=8665 RepID=V8PAN6_OPHHA|nr:hypothetical protein L345_03158 [Ophiophagus hannah]
MPLPERSWRLRKSSCSELPLCGRGRCALSPSAPAPCCPVPRATLGMEEASAKGTLAQQGAAGPVAQEIWERGTGNARGLAQLWPPPRKGWWACQSSLHPEAWGAWSSHGSPMPTLPPPKRMPACQATHLAWWRCSQPSSLQGCEEGLCSDSIGGGWTNSRAGGLGLEPPSSSQPATSHRSGPAWRGCAGAEPHLTGGLQLATPLGSSSPTWMSRQAP